MSRSLPSLIVGKLRHRPDPPAPRLDAPPAVSVTEGRSSEPPIFVVGCFRSGTSLVRRILDSHSRIACPPESKFMLPLVSLLRSGSGMRGLRGMGYEREAVAAALGRFAASFFEGYAAARGKPRWADKTPDYVECLEELREIFADRARFVLIYRHGMDVAYSLADSHRRYAAIDRHVEAAGGDVAVGAGAFWADQTSKIERFRAAHPEASFALRYEDVTRAPEETLRPLFEFLGEPWEPAVLDYHRFEHHRGMEDPDVKRRTKIVQNSGRFQAWPEATQRAVREACEPVLSMVGYG